jgi:excinuclease ABC subunit C
VYRFRDASGRVLYIGRATDLRHRVGSYWSSLRGRRHLAPMVRRIDRIEAVVCDSTHEAAWLERNLLEHAKPRWNRIAGGLEVPVYLRLDTGAAAPGLRVVHEDTKTGRVFGPYLGGERVRLAASALRRVLPLAYTGTRLRGSEREMAAKHGVGPADRDAVVAALVAVLERDPVAVAGMQEQLRVRRERAAAALAFELAARLESEIHAIEWITSPQRVTRPDPDGFDVCGFADGVLVRFEVRGGRLCTWTQRACAPVEARLHVTGSPAAWADFAHRNAELAALLLRAGPRESS